MANSKKKRKSKFRIKKQARWTIAGLLMATAVIIALIPVQNGGVSAKSSDTVPSIEALCEEGADGTGKHGIVDKKVVDPQEGKASPNYVYAFPISTEEQKELRLNNGGEIYRLIDKNGMPSTGPVPIFKLSKEGDDSTGKYNYLVKYTGSGENKYEPPGNTVNLGADVCVNRSKRPYGTEDPEAPGKYITTVSDDPGYVDNTKPGTYIKYTEQLIEHHDGIQNIDYDYFYIIEEEWECFGEMKGDPAVFVPDIGSPRRVGTPKEYYGVKDSTTTGDDSIQNVGHICDKTFYNCGEIQNVILPNNIIEIGESAFEQCSGLKSIEIGDRCTSIGDRAFSSCTKLDSFKIIKDQYISTNLSYIGDCAFAGCEKLTDFIVPNVSNMTIGSGCFINSGLSSIDFETYSSPNITLGCYVFANNENLVNVVLENIGTIKEHKIDDDVAGCGIFTGCTNLSEVTFDNEYQSELPFGTFADCPYLYRVKFRNGSASFHRKKISSDPDKYLTDFNDLNYNFHINGPDDKASKIHTECTECSITYRYKLEPPEDNHFEYFDIYGYRYDFSQLEDGTYGITNISDKNVADTDTLLDIPYSICEYYDITQIGNNASAGLTKKKVTQVNIPDSISVIGDQAFSDMSSLKTVLFTHNRSTVDGRDIPQAATLSIGADVFYKDNKLEDIYLRHYEYESDGTIKEVYDPNITSIGTSEKNGKTVGAFYTEREPATTIHGAMYNRYTDAHEPYLAFTYCMNESTGKCNNKNNGYVYYVTDGPELLEAQYKKRMDGTYGASLLNYPTRETMIKTGIKIDPATGKPVLDDGEYIFTESTLADMILNLTESSPNYNFDARNSFETIYVPDGITTIEDLEHTYTSDNNDRIKYFQNLKPVLDSSGKEVSSTKYILIGKDVKKLPDRAFSSELNTSNPDQKTLNNIVPSTLRYVEFKDDLNDIGNKPFINSKNVVSVVFSKEENPATDSEGIKSGNKSYTYDGNGMIYCTEYDNRYSPEHEDRTLVCFLPGFTATNAVPDPEITRIEDSAFENCDSVYSISLEDCINLREEYSLDGSGKKTIHPPVIPDNFAYDADSLGTVLLPENVTSIGELAFTPEKNHDGPCTEYVITVRIPCYDTLIDEDAFQYNTMATLKGYPDSAAQRYADDLHPTHEPINNVKFEAISEVYTVTFLDQTGQIIGTPEKVVDGGYVQNVPEVKAPAGQKFVEWRASGGKKITDAIYTDTIFVPIFEPENTSSTDTTSTTQPSTSGGSTGSTNTSSTNKTTSSSSTTNRSTTSSASSTAKPIIISGAPTPTVPINQGAANAGGNGSGSGSGSGSNGGSKVATGNTNVVSTAHGLTNNGKMSATVNGSSDNYVIKITETPEADESAKQALTGAFGSLENIRYMPFDISLYDSTGSQKISPVPEGVTVSVTMPIPDDLVIYGGNNKIASTTGGSLETLQPRFTVIDGVPCMNYTVSHLSPYVVYVDTANLTADGTLDATPKTGDPIHPKWFLCIGLAAVSIFLFLKRDKVRVA